MTIVGNQSGDFNTIATRRKSGALDYYLNEPVILFSILAISGLYFCLGVMNIVNCQCSLPAGSRMALLRSTFFY